MATCNNKAKQMPTRGFHSFTEQNCHEVCEKPMPFIFPVEQVFLLLVLYTLAAHCGGGVAVSTIGTADGAFFGVARRRCTALVSLRSRFMTALNAAAACERCLLGFSSLPAAAMALCASRCVCFALTTLSRRVLRRRRVVNVTRKHSYVESAWNERDRK